MLKKGDSLFLNNKGMLVIENVVERDYNDGNGIQQFYELRPVYGNASSLLTVPVAYEENFRQPISAKEAKKIIAEIGNCEDLWIPDNKERKEKFGNIIAKGDAKLLAGIVKTVYKKRAEYIAEKKNLPITDFKYFEYARKLMSEEIAFALNKTVEEVNNMIEEELSK